LHFENKILKTNFAIDLQYVLNNTFSPFYQNKGLVFTFEIHLHFKHWVPVPLLLTKIEFCT